MSSLNPASPFLLRREARLWGSNSCPPTEIKLGLGTSSPTEVMQVCPFRGEGFICTQAGRQVGKQATGSGTDSIPVVWKTLMKNKLFICYIYAGDLDLAYACHLVGDSVSGRPQGSRLVISVGLSVESLSSFGPSIFLPVFL